MPKSVVSFSAALAAALLAAPAAAGDDAGPSAAAATDGKDDPGSPVEEKPAADAVAAPALPPPPVPPPPQRLLFVRDRALWASPEATPDSAVKLAGLPVESKKLEVRRLEPARDGSAVLVVLGAGAGGIWIDLGGTRQEPAQLPEAVECAGEIHLDPPGNSTLCALPDGSAHLRRLRPALGRKEKTIASVGKEVHFYAGPRTLVARDADGVWAITIRTPDERRKLAPTPPDSNMAVSPDGRRAVGWYVDGVSGHRALYTLALDGKGVQRRLSEGGVPISWSADSEWLVLQDGDKACVLRATGGQHKCWKGYRAIGVDAEVKDLLMLGAKAGKDGASDLYRGELAGAHTAAPRRVLRGVQGAAWLSGSLP